MARQLGRVRSRTAKGRTTYYLDFRPFGEVYSQPNPSGKRGIPIRDRETARDVLAAIRNAMIEGKTTEAALAPYRPASAPAFLVSKCAKRWVKVQQDRCRLGDLSPTYIRELERYMDPDRYAAFWAGMSVYQVNYGTLDEFSLWLGNEKKLGARTRGKVLDAYRGMMKWLKRRNEIGDVPEFPTVPADEYAPTIISTEVQFTVLETIPWERRGAFLACRLGIRPSEVRPLDVTDLDGSRLMITKGTKGPNASAPVRGTKTRKPRPVYVDEPLRKWIEWRLESLTAAERIGGNVPLFPNPTARNAEKRWLSNALREEWNRACAKLGITVKMYEGTKHSSASAAVRSGKPLEVVQAALGHADRRSTERYAKLDDQAVVDVFPTVLGTRDPG